MGKRVQRMAGGALPGVLLLALILLAYPVNIGVTRWGLALSIPALALAASAILFKRKILRLVPLGILLLACAVLALPGREGDAGRLRERYVKELRSYEGCRYVWGGENSLGIDCSGLVRKALLAANVKEGLATFNPGLLRKALWLWWNDCVARELGEGYRGKTQALYEAKSINALEQGKLMPGDLAVTKDGVHVLACLGAGEWIEADPGAMKVISVKIPAPDNAWFEMPVKIVRWTQLESPAR